VSGPTSFTPSAALLEHAASLRTTGHLVVLTGAGISAESGIPTFRGREGYWTVGSREYHPMELATAAAFAAMPQEVWAWYLMRRAVCRAATPNAAHVALARLGERLGDRLTLVTQNIDGLHLRAGSAAHQILAIHGDIGTMRCVRDCGAPAEAIPDAFDGWTRSRRLTPPEADRLRCIACGGATRPYILWFDEYYDDRWYPASRALKASQRCDALWVIGTSGATNVPMQMGALVAGRRRPLVDVNPEANLFTDLSRRSAGGNDTFVCAETACSAVPALVEALIG
jgi:NAD-dependent deacetylase